MNKNFIKQLATALTFISLTMIQSGCEKDSDETRIHLQILLRAYGSDRIPQTGFQTWGSNITAL